MKKHRKLLLTLFAVLLSAVALAAAVALFPPGSSRGSQDRTRSAVAQSLGTALVSRGILYTDIEASVQDAMATDAYVVTLASSSADGRATPDDNRHAMAVRREASLLKGTGARLDAISVRCVDSTGKVVFSLDTVVDGQAAPQQVDTTAQASLQTQLVSSVEANLQGVPATEKTIALDQAPDGTRTALVAYEVEDASTLSTVIDDWQFLTKAAVGIGQAAHDLGVVIHVYIVQVVDAQGSILAQFRDDYDSSGEERARSAQFANGFVPTTWRIHGGGGQ